MGTIVTLIFPIRRWINLLKLLIADDELIERGSSFYYRTELSGHRHHQEASNGREAISINSTFKPDIVLWI